VEKISSRNGPLGPSLPCWPYGSLKRKARSKPMLSATAAMQPRGKNFCVLPALLSTEGSAGRMPRTDYSRKLLGGVE